MENSECNISWKLVENFWLRNPRNSLIMVAEFIVFFNNFSPVYEHCHWVWTWTCAECGEALKSECWIHFFCCLCTCNVSWRGRRSQPEDSRIDEVSDRCPALHAVTESWVSLTLSVSELVSWQVDELSHFEQFVIEPTICTCHLSI